MMVEVKGCKDFTSDTSILSLVYVKETGRKPFPAAVYCSSGKPTSLDYLLPQ